MSEKTLFEKDVISRSGKDPQWESKELSFIRWIVKEWIPSFFSIDGLLGIIVNVVISLIAWFYFSTVDYDLKIKTLVILMTLTFISFIIFQATLIGFVLPSAAREVRDRESKTIYRFKTLQSILYYPLSVVVMNLISFIVTMALYLNVFLGVKFSQEGVLLSDNKDILMTILGVFITTLSVSETFSCVKNRIDLVLYGEVSKAYKAK